MKEISKRTGCAVAVVLLIAGLALRAEATDYTSSGNGNWHSTSTWGGFGYPNAGTDNAVISAGHTVTVAEASTAYTISNLTVSGVLTHLTNNGVANPHVKIDLTILGDLTVHSNGAISADSKGYAPGQGPAPGGVDHGGRHGGLGGASSEANANLYTTCGSVTNPTALGSGAGVYGGGAVILRVSGTTTVNGGGWISTEGMRSANFASGGAGGSVNLRTGSLLGGGLIQADGGVQDPGGNVRYAGGGGRVAVRLTSGDSFDAVTIRALGGSGNYGQNNRGAPGTVYRQTASQGEGNGEVIIDAGGLPTAAFVTTVMSTNVSDTMVGSLVITNSGVLTIGSNVTLTVTRDFFNHTQTVSLGTNGTLRVGGSGTSTVGGTAGTTRFYNLACTNAGKRIEFTTGRTNRLDGILTLQGASGNEVKLAGTGTGKWAIAVPSPFAGSVSYVDVTNSDASAGATIAAYDSINRGGNVNWSFASVGQTNLWAGASNTSWGVAANWDLGRLPVVTDVIRISTDNSPPRWPVLNDHALASVLRVEGGAKLSLGGWNLTVSSNLVMAGTLVASSNETVTLQGNADWSGGTFSNATSKVVLGGTGLQTLSFSGIAFNHLLAQNTNALTLGGSFFAASLTNTGGALTFPNAITAGWLVNQGGNLTFGADVAATNFVCRRPGVTLRFKDGATYSFTNLTLAGSVASPLILESASPATKWQLNVSLASFVSAVTVSDSDANGGRTIRPVASGEGLLGSTMNWDFGSGAWKVWTGGNSAFMASTNWSPSGTPDATSRLYIPTTNGIADPLLTNAVTVAELAIGGASAASLTLQAPLVVAGRVVVLPDGVLTHTANTTNELYKLDLTVSNELEIAPGGAISVDGKGFQSYAGPAPGTYGGTPWYGAGHGGMGGHEEGHVASPYPTYGSVTNPVTLGSGGATAGGNETPGGGVAILRVSGQTYIHEGGRISANVPDAGGFWRGGGAGGSVNFVTATLAGNGVIQAHGGRGTVVGGGGGRVAVRLTSGNSLGGVAVTAYGGLDGYINGTRYGAAGTVYRQMAAQGEGQGDLIVDNNSYSTPSDVTTLISTNVTDAVGGDVLIRNGGRFALATNCGVVVFGSWSNTATFTSASGSVVRLRGNRAAGISGSQTFWNLDIEATDKVITFQAGRTNWVNESLKIRGATLQSSVTGTWWHIRLSSNATQKVKNVNVQDSNATNGQEIVAQPSSRDWGRNVNWKFIKDFGTVLMLQ